METYNKIKSFGNNVGAVGNIYQLSKPMKIKGQHYPRVAILTTTEQYLGYPELGNLCRMVSYLMPAAADGSGINNFPINEAEKINDFDQNLILNMRGYWEVQK